MKLPHTLCLFLFLFSTNITFAQKSDLNITIHARVDTAQSEKREIADLWINYLSSKPNSFEEFWRTEALRFK